MNSRILFLSIAMALPLSIAMADEAVETRAIEVDAEGAAKRLKRPERFAELELLLEAGQAQVAQLVEQLRAADSPEQQNEIQNQIVAAKRAHRERFLMERMLLAEEQGDLIQADEARRQLEHLRNENNGKQLRIERPVPSQGGSR